MMNVLIFILAYDVQSAMTVAYDLDERVSSHGEKKNVFEIYCSLVCQDFCFCAKQK
jgi:hypothetical protein